MAACFKAGLDDARPVIEKRPYRVTNDLCAGEQIREFVSRIFDFGDFVVGRFNSRNTAHHFFDLFAIPASCDEGHVVLAEEFSNQPSRESAGSIENDRPLGAHHCS
jgi:hypothetical protein